MSYVTNIFFGALTGLIAFLISGVIVEMFFGKNHFQPQGKVRSLTSPDQGQVHQKANETTESAAMLQVDLQVLDELLRSYWSNEVLMLLSLLGMSKSSLRPKPY